MGSKMLVDATHAEETRVVVVRGNRIEEFDFESAARKQLKGNIYLAKVTRVEPSLQAAFVEYGGNRHGFLCHTPGSQRFSAALRMSSSEAGDSSLAGLIPLGLAASLRRTDDVSNLNPRVAMTAHPYAY